MTYKYTVFTSVTPSTLGKTYRLTSGGTLEKATASQMTNGSYAVQTCADLEELASQLSAIRHDQAISTSLPTSGLASGEVVAQTMLADNPGAIARTKEHFQLAEGPGLLSLDYDAPTSGVVMSAAELLAAFDQLLPEAKGCGVLHYSSGSSSIFNGETELQGLRGQRLYLLVGSAADIPRIGSILHARAALQGGGRIEISKSGALLERSLFDNAMFNAARLDFCGGAVCEPPLAQRRPEPKVLRSGGAFDSLRLLPTLSREEEAKAKAAWRDLKEKAQPEAEKVREAWKAERLTSTTLAFQKKGQSRADAQTNAEQMLQKALDGLLLGDFEIPLYPTGTITVAELLDNPNKWGQKPILTRSPLEPDYRNGSQTGIIWLWPEPVLYDQAHGGGRRYRLRRQPSAIELRHGMRSDVATQLAEKFCEQDDLFYYNGFPCLMVEGQVIQIKKHNVISYLAGKRFAITRRLKDGSTQPCDLDEATAATILTLLGA